MKQAEAHFARSVTDVAIFPSRTNSAILTLAAMFPPGELSRRQLDLVPVVVGFIDDRVQIVGVASTISPLRTATTLPSFARVVENEAAEADVARQQRRGECEDCASHSCTLHPLLENSNHNIRSG